MAPKPISTLGITSAVAVSLRLEAEYYSGMSTVDNLLAAVLDLPLADRARLVRQVAESLDSEADLGAAQDWAIEIGERVHALQRGELASVSAAEVFARARARLSVRSSG